MKLTLINFQKHEHETFDLSSPIVSFSGRTNAGKSSVLRALRWLCLNQPRGDAWALRWGAKEVKVILEIDGHTITRSSGQANLYNLDGKDFKAFGADVPDPIAKILNVDEINFSNQMDSPFWFSLTPGECAKELNRIVRLDKIDETLAAIASTLRRCRSENEVGEKRLAEAREKRDGLAWVEECNTDWEMVEAKYDELVEIASKRLRIARIVEDGGKVKEEAGNAAEAILDALQAVSVADEYVDLVAQREGLGDLVEKVETEGRTLCQVKQKHTEVSQKLEKVKKCPTCGNPQISLPS